MFISGAMALLAVESQDFEFHGTKLRYASDYLRPSRRASHRLGKNATLRAVTEEVQVFAAQGGRYSQGRRKPFARFML